MPPFTDDCEDDSAGLRFSEEQQLQALEKRSSCTEQRDKRPARPPLRMVGAERALLTRGSGG